MKLKGILENISRPVRRVNSAQTLHSTSLSVQESGRPPPKCERANQKGKRYVARAGGDVGLSLNKMDSNRPFYIHDVRQRRRGEERPNTAADARHLKDR